jgi:hypothetical protein
MKLLCQWIRFRTDNRRQHTVVNPAHTLTKRVTVLDHRVSRCEAFKSFPVVLTKRRSASRCLFMTLHRTLRVEQTTMHHCRLVPMWSPDDRIGPFAEQCRSHCNKHSVVNVIASSVDLNSHPNHIVNFATSDIYESGGNLATSF